MAEFDLIATYFAPLAGLGAGGLLDDAAVLDIPAGHQLVVTSDTSNRGDHFVEEMSPRDAARKCLRSNLSDLAAMGADPFTYQLNLALPTDIDESWMAEFAAGLAVDQKEFGISISGGDTTGMAAGGLSVSITAFGLVPTGRAVSRGGAQDGDLVVVTGILGDAFLSRLHMCTPRTVLAPFIREYANAAVDISDGLPADLGHICEVSGLYADIEFAKIPFSEKGYAALKSGEATPQDILTWGEDYELVMAVPPAQFEEFQKQAADKGVTLSAIGTFSMGEGITIVDKDGQPMNFDKMGWTHF